MTEPSLRRLAKGVLILTTILFGVALVPAGLVGP